MGTIGGGAVEQQVIREALEVLRLGAPRRFDYRLRSGEELGMICGGDVEVFIEPVAASPRLFIFGAGHIAVPLAAMARLVDFTVTVIDDRDGFATPERFPDASRTLSGSFADAFGKLDIEASSSIVILTHGHTGDEDVLARALKTTAGYIGMIGSKEKIRAVFGHLREKGYAQEELDRVHSPIGARIRAQTPQEIAVSILAELILVRRSGP